MKMHSALEMTMNNMKIFFSVGRLMKQSTVLGQGSSVHLDNLKEMSETSYSWYKRLCFHLKSNRVQVSPGQIVAMIYPVEDVEEWRVESSLEDQTKQIRPPQSSSLLSWIGIQVRALMQLHILLVLSFTKFYMRYHHQWRAGDKDQLQRPQTDVGDGEDVVVADIGAARLEAKKKVFFFFLTYNSAISLLQW